MKRSVDTTSETAGAGDHVETLARPANLYAWKEGDAVGDVLCCVQSRRRTHFMNYWKDRLGEGKKKCSLAFVGKLYLQVRKHLVLQPGTDRRLFITFTIVNTTAVMRFVSCSCGPGAEMLCSCSLVPGPPGIAALSCQNGPVVLSLREGLKFA